MTISFIVTTYNIAAYIEPCLDSVARCARPGDEVIVIDDCSNDGTTDVVQKFLASDAFAKDVTLRPLYLGANTFGGVGCPGNIGLKMARCDTVFFVDGDDWIDHDGFTSAREAYEANPSDIMFVNYLEYDEANNLSKKPADYACWNTLNTVADFEEVRLQALALVAVPWRKFYNRAFVEAHRLRYPEGDFFFEDNPFHWQVCLAAKTIRFFDMVICHHRVNRPGQTMASTGKELIAFFTHFITIKNMLPPNNRVLQAAAGRWILGNMSWHLGRLKSQARLSYFQAAARVLPQIDDVIWDEYLAPTEGEKHVWPIASRLRDGDVWGCMDSLQIEQLKKQGEQLKKEIRIFKTIDQFKALKGLVSALKGKQGPDRL